MNRNTNANHFELAPSVDIQRSRFPRPSQLKTSFNVGELIPIYVDEVLPGDTWEMTTSMVSRLQTLKTPVYDNIYLDTYFFFVPNRLVWEHWVNLMGELSDSPWVSQIEYTTPTVTSPAVTGWTVGSLADYLGIPIGVSGLSVNALPFRAYAKIVQDWFLDQNLQQPVNIPLGDSTVAGSNGDNYVTDLVKGGKPFIACKLHDYFTSCLPNSQRGDAVQVPLASGADNLLPVFTIKGPNDYYASEQGAPYGFKLTKTWPVYYDNPGHYTDTSSTLPPYEAPQPGFFQAMNDYSVDPKGEKVNVGTDQRPFLPATHGSDGKTLMGLNQAKLYSDYELRGLTPVNLVAGSVSNAFYMATVNSLRQAFQIQRMLEVDARSGVRYCEVIAAHFKISAGDSRLQRSEYLGGKRCPLNISQVTQLGATNEVSPLGDVAGMSVTASINEDFVKSFTEHGHIIGLAVARYDHTYQQGLEKLWTRSDRYSYYWPTLAHLGEQPVLVESIYATGDPSVDKLVFGYQEAWADYRFKFSKCTGSMRSTAPTSLDIWHFGDDYSERPSLSSSWIVEDKSNVDRTLAVTSSVADQIFSDFDFRGYVTRPMPLYSIPGLIDHF